MPDFDDWIDERLRDVPVPPQLNRRLMAIGSTRGEPQADKRLDAVLQSVPVPLTLAERLREIARRRRPLPVWPYAAMAAAALVVLSVISLREDAPDQAQGDTANDAAAPDIASAVELPGFIPPAAEAKVVSREPVSASQSADAHEQFAPPSEPAPAHRIQPVSLPWGDLRARAGQWLTNMEKKRVSLETLGSGGQLDRLPTLEAYEPVGARGISPPRVRGYDLMFHLKHGEQPFVPPAVPELASSRMPFSFTTVSFDRLAQTGLTKSSPAEEIRVEDFVAAQNYPLPSPPAHGLSLHLAASPSPLGDRGLHLLQVAVQSEGARNRPVARPPAHLIVALESSGRMTAAGRWQTALRSLDRVASQLQPRDRVTVLACAESPEVLVAGATARHLRESLPDLQTAARSGHPNLEAGIAAAIAAAERDLSGRPRIVLLTAGHQVEPGGEANWQRLEENQFPWQVIQLGTDSSSRGGTRDDDHVASARFAGEVAALIAGKLNGQPAVSAADVALKLTFNPQVVTGYRLLGHAQPTLTGDTSGPLSVELPPGESAMALYELWVKPDGNDVIATAELTWHDPAAGQPRRLVRAMRRGQVAEAFAQSPAWFQQAVVAAKTAEVLRGSYFSPSLRPFTQVRELAKQVEARTSAGQHFRTLIELLDAAERLH
jgi:Ca-activated chloride channel family protein